MQKSTATILGILTFASIQGCVTPPSTDDDQRPANVLLIGDSIATGYWPTVQERLKGRANVERVSAGSGQTTAAFAKLDEWMGRTDWDVIHFNWGLNDLERQGDRQRVPLEQYEKNLRRIVRRLKQSGAALIWCSTTPIPPGPLSSRRDSRDAPRYNAVAETVMDAGGVETNDLYAFSLPRLGEIQLKGDVHFTERGYAALGEEVARHIRRVLRRSGERKDRP